MMMGETGEARRRGEETNGMINTIKKTKKEDGRTGRRVMVVGARKERVRER